MSFLFHPLACFSFSFISSPFSLIFFHLVVFPNFSILFFKNSRENVWFQRWISGLFRIFFPFRSILITFLFASIFDPLCLHTTLSFNRVGVFTHRGLRFPLPRRRRRRRRIFGLLDLRAIFNRFFRFLRGFGSFSFPFSFPLGFFSPDLSQVTNSCVSPLMYVPKSLIFSVLSSLIL